MRFRRTAHLEAGLRNIYIVPLVNCILLLLVFFVITTGFVGMSGINVRLPATITSDEVGLQALTVAISAENIIYVNSKPKTMAEIENIIKKHAYTSVFIKAERAASLGAVVDVWDMCKRLGIEKIGIASTFEE